MTRQAKTPAGRKARSEVGGISLCGEAASFCISGRKGARKNDENELLRQRWNVDCRRGIRVSRKTFGRPSQIRRASGLADRNRRTKLIFPVQTPDLCSMRRAMIAAAAILAFT